MYVIKDAQSIEKMLLNIRDKELCFCKFWQNDSFKLRDNHGHRRRYLHEKMII